MLFFRSLAPVALLSLLIDAAPARDGHPRGGPPFGRPSIGRPGFPSFGPPAGFPTSAGPVAGVPATPISGGPIPTTPATSSCTFPSCLNRAGCAAPDAADVEVPAGLAAPSGAVNFAMLGRGVQNYTCTNGTFVAAGAVAKLYDINCLSDAGDATSLPALALSSLPTTSSLPHAIDHYFIPNGVKAAPKFALAAGGGATFNTYSATTSVPAENAAVDVASLQLGSTGAGPGGALGGTAYRLSTAGGQPPSSCSQPGQQLSVQYAALYYFMG